MAADIRFLVVDDFSMMRALVRRLLRQLGHTNVEEAADGAAALEKLRAGAFDFVVSDLNMPNMTGLELIRAMQADESLKEIPVLVASSEGAREDIAKHAGASGYIAKPVRKGALEEKLKQILQQRRS